MVTLIFAVLLAFVCLLSVAVRKTYSYVPYKELKREARRGDPLAAALYRAVAYGPSLNIVLWTFIGLSAAASFVLLTRVTPGWLAFILVALLVVYGFAWMPSGKLTSFGARLALWVAPPLAWLLGKLHPLLDVVALRFRRIHPITIHTGLYEQEDLEELFENQKSQSDSRISTETLDLLLHALSFGNKTVGSAMVPRRAVRMASQDDVIGPVLMTELHNSGYSRFPVYGEKKDQIIGTLYLRDMVRSKQGGKILSVMHPSVYYVHEDYSLEQALHAFLKTKHHLFIVVNAFEEFVGIITIEDILEQVIGHKIVDEFDRYDDMRAVAEHAAKKEHKEHAKQEVPGSPVETEAENSTSSEETVVE